jgi:hypothetical protein
MLAGSGVPGNAVVASHFANFQSLAGTSSRASLSLIRRVSEYPGNVLSMLAGA